MTTEFKVYRRVNGNKEIFCFFVTHFTANELDAFDGTKIEKFAVGIFPVNFHMTLERANDAATKYCDYLNQVVAAEREARKGINLGQSAS